MRFNWGLDGLRGKSGAAPVLSMLSAFVLRAGINTSSAGDVRHVDAPRRSRHHRPTQPAPRRALKCLLAGRGA